MSWMGDIGSRAHSLLSRQLYYGAYLSMRMPAEVSATRELLANCDLSAARIAEIQTEKLRRLITHAYVNVPYYRSVFDRLELDPSDISAAADLVKLPVLTKEIIQREAEQLQAVNLPASHGRASINHTGGSTGEPLAFYQDDLYRAVASGNLSRSVYMTGWRDGDRAAHLWGSEFDARRRRGARGKLLAFARNEVFLNAFGWSEEDMVEFVQVLVKFRPKLLIGYVSALVSLAQVIRERDLERPRPQAIESAAETLTSTQREFLEDTFACKVFNRYGCREVANIAHDCSRHEGLHIFSDVQAVEVLRNGGPAAPGEEGLIVVTNLDNYAMPFIRYVVGDVGTLSARRCSCDLPFPLMEDVKGRVSDVITSPSGRLIHGEYFSHLFYSIPGVRQFQVAQETVDDLLVRVVPGAGFDPTSLSRLEPTIRSQCDPGFSVRVEVVPVIPVSASGKFRFTVSAVTPRFDDLRGR